MMKGKNRLGPNYKSFLCTASATLQHASDKTKGLS